MDLFGRKGLSFTEGTNANGEWDAANHPGGEGGKSTRVDMSAISGNRD